MLARFELCGYYLLYNNIDRLEIMGANFDAVACNITPALAGSAGDGRNG